MGKIIPPKPGAGTGLHKVAQDTEYRAVRRRGRFSIESEVALNSDRLLRAVHEAQEAMIEGLRRAQGLEWMSGTEFELRGPLPHVGFDDDVKADPGPTSIPRDASLDGLLRWSNDEAKRRAKDMNKPTDMVDFILVGTFIRKITGGYRMHIPETRQ